MPSSLIVLSVVITKLWFGSGAVLRLIKTPVESFYKAKSYFFQLFWHCVYFGYNAFSAIMRGMRDGKNSLIFVAVACEINVILDLVIVCVFKTGTPVASFMSFVIGLLFFISEKWEKMTIIK